MKNSIASFVVSLASVLAPATPLARADIIIDLKTGVITETFASTSPAPVSAAVTYQTADGYATVAVQQKGSGCTTTPYEALVSVNLAPADFPRVNKMSVTIEYDGAPSGWTTHLGDDINNDGYGGGSSIQGVAEAHLIGQAFYIYSTGLSAGVVEKVLESKMRLTDSALHFTVSDQKLTVGQPYTMVESNNLKQLFDLTGSGADKKLFLGLNRVIRDGSPRKGCGARRAIISFEQ